MGVPLQVAGSDQRPTTPLHVSALLPPQVLKPHKQASAVVPTARDRQAAEEAAALVGMQRLAVGPADSLRGGVHDMPGSEVRRCGGKLVCGGVGGGGLTSGKLPVQPTSGCKGSLLCDWLLLSSGLLTSSPSLLPLPLPTPQCTVSRAPAKRKGAEPAHDPELVDEAAAQPGFLDATQASGLQRGRGKASFVRDPIEQASAWRAWRVGWAV